MAESFSVKAILSAADKGFTSAFEKANKVSSGLGDRIKSGLGFGILMGAGQQAFSSITNGIRGVVGELGSSSAAWKTFEGNMGMLGKGNKEIKATKKELQKFATQTIYSASDMSTTYAQLAAVGTKNCTQLVKGFGGLASAAENPQQAMKTLSQQATQMAAKPQVAWQDFKLMLEQTPAGIAAVAKEMGMTTSQLVTNVQDGKIATDDFFDAITKVGTNDAFTKLATEYKTVDQAMDGLKETLGVKLGPAFEKISEIGINSISGIIDKMDKIDATSIANSIMGMVTTVEPYWNSFKGAVSTAAEACGEAFGAIGSAVGELLSKQSTIDGFTVVVKGVGDAIAFVADIIATNADTIVSVTPYILGLAVAFKAFKVVKGVATSVMSFTSSIGRLANQKLGKVADDIVQTASAQNKAGRSSAGSAKKMLASAKSFMMLGAGVLLVAAGFALLAYSAIQLADAGPLAIGVMAGLVVGLAGVGAGMGLLLKTLAPMGAKMMPVATAMLAMGAAVILVAAGFAILTLSAINLANAGPLAIGVMLGLIAAVAGLALGASILGPALTAGTVGFIAFGAAVALVGVGALLAATALMLVAGVLPILVEYGLSGAVSIAALGASMLVFGAGALVAGAASLVLGAGLILVGVGALGAAIGVLALAVATIALGAGLNLCGVGAVVLGPALLTLSVGALASSVSLLALTAAVIAFTAGGVASLAGTVALTAGFVAFGASLIVVTAGMVALAAGLLGVLGSMKAISSSAKSTEKSLKAMKSSISFVNSALEGLGSLAKSALKSFFNAFSNAEGKAKSAGQNVGNNISAGVKSGMTKLPLTVSASLMQATAVMALAQTQAYSAGVYIGQGLGNGMSSQIGYVRNVAAQLAAAAEKAIRAKAQIHSPSKVSDKLGAYFGQGFGNGILDMATYVSRAAEELFSIPKAYSPKLAFSGLNGTLSDEYSYYQNAEFNINIPFDVDGKEFAHATGHYTQEELEKLEKFKNYLKGVR